MNPVCSAPTIIARESKRKGHVKYSRHYRFHYCEVAATFAGTPVKLFFYRNGRKGDWNALLSINTALGAYEAYIIYSMRWECRKLIEDTKDEKTAGGKTIGEFYSDKENFQELVFSVVGLKIMKMSNSSIWFTIREHYGKYYIALYYDNLDFLYFL